MTKYIVLLGGVISGTGKGIAAASIGLLLKQRGYNINIIKFDPYLNVSASCLSPLAHGEVFLCDDGSECDLDIGHYHRLSSINVSKNNIYTSGKLTQELHKKQDYGEYLGSTLQVVPHFTNLIIEKIELLSKESDIVISEIGGTVGDIESNAFCKAISQLKIKYGDDCLVVMVAPILWFDVIKEFKTKPLQRSIADIQSFGIQPDILLCRTSKTVPEKILHKISNLTFIPKESIFEAPDVPSIYQVPIEFYNRHIDDLIVDKLRLKRTACRIYKYRDLVEKYINSNNLKNITIGIVGKYENCEEAYISLKEAIYHAGLANNVKVKIKWINAELVEKDIDLLNGVHGIIIPGGFDSRGVEGKILAAKFCRENKIPFLGICLGLQCAVIEFARNVCNIKHANSVEFNKKTSHPVVHFVEGQEILKRKNETMRLGAYDCEVKSHSLAMEVYRKKNISERHRHRYEVNNKYSNVFEENKFLVSGRNPESNLIEIMELDKSLHPYYIGIQAHPEFKSRLTQPHPLFKSLVSYSLEYSEKN